MNRTLASLATAFCSAVWSSGALAACDLDQVATFQHEEIGVVPILRDARTGAVAFLSQMHVNTDGAPDSYHPDDIGITHICNGVSLGASCRWKASCLDEFNKAKAEGFTGPAKICFFAMATKPDGAPIIQAPSDPKPGYFVSTTALKQPGESPNTPQAQLDSNQVPYAVIPRSWQKKGEPGPKLGDIGVAYRKSTGALSFFVVADVGPDRKLGEGSVALHQALGNDPFVTSGGKRRAKRGIGGRDVFFVIFPGTADRSRKLDASSIREVAEPLLGNIGGKQRLAACAK